MGNSDLKEALAKRYVDILQKKEYQKLLEKIENQENGFSNVHLGFVPQGYENATNKILIVGRETRGWRKNIQLRQYTIDDVKTSMQDSRSCMEKNLSRKQQKGAAFFNFVRKVAQQSGESGILWANIFAVDYKTKHPKYAADEDFNNIKALSRELLCAQMDILQPSIILFVSGSSGIKARREYFPNLSGSGKGIAGMEKGLLEQFSFLDGDYEKIKCYRASHPSTRRKAGRIALKKLIELLPAKND